MENTFMDIEANAQESGVASITHIQRTSILAHGWDNFGLAIIVNTFLFLVPFICLYLYDREPHLKYREYTLNTALFLAGINLSTYKVPYVITGLLLVLEVILFLQYGAYRPEENIPGYNISQTYFIVFGMIVMILDKFNFHVLKREPITLFRR